MKVYLAGPMRGIPEFNFPAFHRAAANLRARGHTVFNPAERDEEKYGQNFFSANPTGCMAVVEKQGFSLREALAADMKFICEEAEAIFLLPGWENSKGACAERATAAALGLQIVYLDALH